VVLVEKFHCPNCSAPLEYQGDAPVVSCSYCNSSVIVPEFLRSVQSGGREANDSSPVRDLGSHTASLGQMSDDEIVTRVQEVVRLASQGNKTKAIRQFRETFPVGMTEARLAVEMLAMSGMDNIHVAHWTSAFQTEIQTPQSNEALEAEIRDLLNRNQKITAIKQYREYFDSSLSAAKDAVEKFEQGGPLLSPPQGRVRTQTLTMSPGAQVTISPSVWYRGCLASLIWVVILAAIAVGIMSAFGFPVAEFRNLNSIMGALGRPVLSFGAEGTGAGFFQDPRIITTDPDGNIIVGEFSTGRIQRFDAEGNYLSMISIGDQVYLDELAVDQDGVLYAAYMGSIWRYDLQSGTLLDLFDLGDSRRAESFALLPTGGIAVFDARDNLFIYDQNRQVTLELPKIIESVTNKSELNAHIAIDGLGMLYVSGTFNAAIFIYTPDGRYQNRFSSAGEHSFFSSSGRLAVDAQSRIYMPVFDGLDIYDTNGRLLKHINVRGAVRDVHVTPAGELLILTSEPKVHIYRLDDLRLD
jgi:ribosomal protein L7/L12